LVLAEAHEIVQKRKLAPRIHWMRVRAPLVARRAKPGHFAMVLAHDKAERIPLTIVDRDPDEGTIALVVQEMGTGTAEIGRLRAGDRLSGVLGPLGRAGEIQDAGEVILVCGGIGVAPMYPYAKAYRARGARLTTIVGARTKEMLIMLDEMKSVSHRLLVSTDDGSLGTRGFVTDVLAGLLSGEERFDLAVCIGPAVMMKAVCRLTRSYGLRTVVSLNPIMIDGTGMCGGCRVTVGGEVKFACVDGPEFDGHLVDFDELMTRQRAYIQEERTSYELHKCAGRE
jgi:ferredoxin--NADP+ reductase